MATSACCEGDFASVMPVRPTCVQAQIDLLLYFLALVLKKSCISYCHICWCQGHLERQNDRGWREPHCLWMGRCFASGRRLPSVCFDNPVGLDKRSWQASGSSVDTLCYISIYSTTNAPPCWAWALMLSWYPLFVLPGILNSIILAWNSFSFLEWPGWSPWLRGHSAGSSVLTAFT